MSDITTYHRGQRNFGTGYDMIDQIETLEAKLAKAVEALESVHRFGVITHPALATLAEISSEAALNKGESHE